MVDATFPTSPPVFRANPVIEGEESAFVTLDVDPRAVLKSYQSSLFSYEWMNGDGSIKSFDDLKPSFRAQYSAVRAAWESGEPLPMSILGIGLMGNIEMGSGRDVFLTLAASGVKVIPVHVPIQMRDEFRAYMAKEGTPTQRGSVVAYLLIILVMIATLGYAISRTTRSSSTQALTSAQSSTYASEALTYAQHIQDAVTRLTLRGCTDAQISFANIVVSGYTNASAPADESCHIFSPVGGNINWVTPPDLMNDGTPWFYTGDVVVHNDHGYDSAHVAADADLVMMLFNVPIDICTKINATLGVTGIPVNYGDYTSTLKFQGTYSTNEDINGLSAAAQPSPCTSGSAPTPNFCGAAAGCFREETGAQRYIFFQTLIQR